MLDVARGRSCLNELHKEQIIDEMKDWMWLEVYHIYISFIKSKEKMG